MNWVAIHSQALVSSGPQLGLLTVTRAKELYMFEIIAVTKALADESRVRLLAALEDKELCVCQLTELIGLASSTVSKHLSILRSARLIESRKEGRWMYYRLADALPQATQEKALTWLMGAINDQPRIRADRQRLAEILTKDPEVLCRQQSQDAAKRSSAGIKRAKIAQH
ncbi:MAG: ArsR family transcriptional regulator [Desulfobacteraceae bacterium]|nr:MAG: ArsR family transcriptional regulator [Desulfobacteraceae bacterium]